MDSESMGHGRQTKNRRDRPPKVPQAQVQTETLTLAMAQALQLAPSMAMSYERRVKDHLRAYENKIEEFMELCQENVDGIVALEP